MPKPRPLPPVRDWRTVPPVLTCDELQALLACGRTHLDDLIDAGLPYLNIGHERRAGKTGRTRRTLRFIWQDVIAWLRTERCVVAACTRGSAEPAEKETARAHQPEPLPKVPAVARQGVATGIDDHSSIPGDQHLFARDAGDADGPSSPQASRAL